jgi:hypothetical protein
MAPIGRARKAAPKIPNVIRSEDESSGAKNDLGENWCQRQIDHEVEPRDDLTNGAQNYRSLSSRILGGINDAAIA